MTTEEMDKLLQKHAAQLAEHFDSVQIFCTKVAEDGGTARFSTGEGDYFARYGGVLYWVRFQDGIANEEAKEHARREDWK